MTKSEKLRTALKLHLAGVQMKKLQLRRKNPNASPERLQTLYSQWIRTSNVLSK